MTATRRTAVGRVAYPTVHVLENDTGPDDCDHAQHGSFILAGPTVTGRGGVQGADLLNVAPTLLEIGGYDVPTSMRERTPIQTPGSARVESEGYTAAGEAIVRERLSEIGYIG